jgi:hypothetical protein
MAVATALPGTVLILAALPLAKGRPPAAGLTLAGVTLWSALFGALTYAINRRAYLSARNMAADYWRKYFPARAEVRIP